MSIISYLNYAEIVAFEGLYQQYQQALDSVDQWWHNFIEGFEFSNADFSQENKKSRIPHAHSTFAEAIKVSTLDATWKFFFHM